MGVLIILIIYGLCVGVGFFLLGWIGAIIGFIVASFISGGLNSI